MVFLWFKGGPQRPLRGGRLGRWLPRGLHDVAAARGGRGVAGAHGGPVAGRRVARWKGGKVGVEQQKPWQNLGFFPWSDQLNLKIC